MAWGPGQGVFGGWREHGKADTKAAGTPTVRRGRKGSELGLGGEDAERPRGDGWNGANGEGFT